MSGPTPNADGQNQGDFARRLAAYSGSSILLRLLRLIYSYAKPKILAPMQLGLWNLLNLIPDYTHFLQLGSMSTMNYWVPRLRAEGKHAEVERIKSTVFRYSRSYISIVLGVCLAAALFGPAIWPNTFTTEIRIGLATIGLITTMNWYGDLQFYLLKGERRFHIISTANVINAFSLILVGVPMLVFYGMYGLFFGALITKIVVMGYLMRAHPLNILPGFDWMLLKDLIREGFPILIFTFSMTLLTTSDRLIIASLLDTEALGYYAIALVASQFVLQIPVSARDMLEPKLMAGQVTESTTAIWTDYVEKPLLKTAILFPFVLGPVVYLTEPALQLLLPDYVETTSATIVLVYGCYFIALVQVIRGIIFANHWQVPIMVIQSIGLATNVLISFYVINLGWGITGVALATGVSFAVVYLMTASFTLWRSPFRKPKSVLLIIISILPFLYATGVVFFLDLTLPGSSVSDIAIKLFLFLGGGFILKKIYDRRSIQAWQ